MESKPFKLYSEFAPAGDQPNAIATLVAGIEQGEQEQVLLGVTGSGKTFTMAHIINITQKPSLIIAHNKTLAAQLYEEMKEFFPENAVEYFVSYYDYYQPEAYIAKTDTYIEKDSAINEKIDRLRHSATRSLLEREDVIVIASVSCIYGLGSPELYLEMTEKLTVNEKIDLKKLQKKLTELQYKRNDLNLTRGTFQVIGDIINIFPSHYANRAWKLSCFGDEIEYIKEFDPINGKIIANLKEIIVFANSHYVTPRPTMLQAMRLISEDLILRIQEFKDDHKLLETERIEKRTLYDLEMIMETGTCKGIENYSRYLSGRAAGSPPPTLFEYFPKNSLLFVDESHVSVPQIGGMYNGDRARKSSLIEHGFRLPSALDNRPLKFTEWEELKPQTIYVSATPGKYELAKTYNKVVEQIIRPTYLVDPECIIRPIETQVDDLLHECQQVIAKQQRVLVITLTKKMAENLAEYMLELNIKVTYLHSDINTLERIEIIHKLRSGIIDVLVGVNLLREGLDIPECGLVAILDADKEGFLRSETSLIQTIGRAARNVGGRVILYADKITGSLERALRETNRRQEKQKEHNREHNITPQSIKKAISKTFEKYFASNEELELEKNHRGKIEKALIPELEILMLKAAEELDFELAASLRDKIRKLKKP